MYDFTALIILWGRLGVSVLDVLRWKIRGANVRRCVLQQLPEVCEGMSHFGRHPWMHHNHNDGRRRKAFFTNEKMHYFPPAVSKLCFGYLHLECSAVLGTVLIAVLHSKQNCRCYWCFFTSSFPLPFRAIYLSIDDNLEILSKLIVQKQSVNKIFFNKTVQKQPI